MSSVSPAKPFISICVPAYKRPANVIRLLESVRKQSFTDFEVVITDDSPDDSVQNILPGFGDLPVRYHKNIKALGTPANWNSGIEMAQGEWIKIMHDDDWFDGADSLQKFADATAAGKKFIVSRYRNVFENGGDDHPAFPAAWKQKIIDNPLLLLSRNVIGPPSVTLIHSSIKEKYDTAMKWRVDIDFYVRLLKTLKDFTLIDDTLVNVGISSTQVTNGCINMPEVELPEGLLMLQKHGLSPLKNIRVYDAWWRVLRNVGVRKKDHLYVHTPGKQWPELMNRMAEHESKIPAGVLKIGAFSKLAMFFSYLFNKRHIRD